MDKYYMFIIQNIIMSCQFSFGKTEDLFATLGVVKSCGGVLGIPSSNLQTFGHIFMVQKLW